MKSPKIHPSLDFDKIIQKFEMVLNILPFLSSIITKQNYYLKTLKIQTMQEQEDIQNDIAFFDIYKKKVVYFIDVKDSRLRFEHQKQARKDKINYNISLFVLEEIRTIQLNEFTIRKNAVYLEEEFLPFWEKYSSDMSREDLQQIWAQIFIVELQTPHTISTRTMDFVRTMKHKEARMLDLIFPYVLDQKAVLPMHNILHDIDFFYLQSIRLLMDHAFIDSTPNTPFILNKELVLIPNQEIYINVWLLSDIARDLYHIYKIKTLNIVLIEEILNAQKNIPIDTQIAFHRILSDGNTNQKINYNKLPNHIYQKKEQIDFNYQNHNLPIISQETSQET